VSGAPGRRGWDQPSRTPGWIYGLVGVLLTLVVVLAIVIFLVLGNGNGAPGLASATSSPTAAVAATSAPAATAPASAAATPEITAAPTAEPTPAPTAASTPAPTAVPGSSASPAPSGSTKPTLVSISLPHKADCNGDNGTGQIGMITVAWTATGATGVRISIDPPTAAGAYDYGYQDYLAPLTSAKVPFACDATLHDSGGYYHLYVVTTLHTTGYYQYRYQKVYQSPAPTP
jgi:hypothetical protein